MYVVGYGPLVMIFSIWVWIGAIAWSLFHIIMGSIHPVIKGIRKLMRKHRRRSNKITTQLSEEPDGPCTAIDTEAERCVGGR